MSLLKKNRTSQYPLYAEFKFNLTDTMLNTAGATVAFGAAAAAVFDAIPLPPNAVLVGGDVSVEAVSDDTGTATIAIGDSGSAVRYLAATTIKTAARLPLVPTGYRGTGEDIRMTLANANGNAANGTVTVRALYIVTGRANEVQYS